MLLQEVIDKMDDKGYKVFEGGKPYNLNIVGLRNEERHAGYFDDTLLLFWKFLNEWSVVVLPCTTDPGAYYLKNPLNEKGTAIIKPAQYLGAMGLGEHKDYEAVVQKEPVTVYRDADRDNILDTKNVEEEKGIFGINIHKAEVASYEDRVRRWSAGCTVMPERHFEVFMSIAKGAVENWGNSLTYTVLEWRS